MSKIKQIESSMKKGSLAGLKEKAKQAKGKSESTAKKSSVKTEEAKASKTSGLKIYGAKVSTTNQPNNPNARTRKKVVANDGHGRLKGQKNLVKHKDAEGNVYGLENEHGVVFTLGQQKMLKAAVDSLERKREKLKNSEVGLLVGYDLSGELTGEKDPLMTREFSKGLHQFKNMKEFEMTMNELREFNSRDYIKNLTEDMKNRYLKTIANTTDMTEKEFEKIQKKISKMSQKEFAMRFGMDLFGTITLYYDNFDTTDRTERKHAALKNNKELEFKKKYKSGKRAQKAYNKWLKKFEHDLELERARLDAMGGGSAVNVEDIKRRLGIGEDSIEVDLKNNRYTQYREQQKAQRERKRQKREADSQAYERKYQQFLNDWGLEDTEKTREKFRSYH